jgi:pilus assembly protein Flp/PilA
MPAPSQNREAGVWVRRAGPKAVGRCRSFLARLRRDTRGQDLIEYALMAGFVAVAAGALMPSISASISTVFSNVASLMTAAAAS